VSQVRSTIKVIEVEEKFDLLFSRPLGYGFAVIARWCRLTPTQVSILSMITGIVAGYCFYFQSDIKMVGWGCFWIVIAGVLDSADGQLARMTQRSSHLGMIIDGFVDNIVYISAYLGGTFYLLSVYGWPIFIISAISGLGHSLRSLIYVLYKDDCLYFYGDKRDAYRPTIDELRDQFKGQQDTTERSVISRILYFLYCDQTRKQWALGTRSVEMYRRFESEKKCQEQKFKRVYKRCFIPILTLWALVGGGNIHRFLIMGFSLMGQFEWFLYGGILLNIPCLVIWWIQRRRDRQFLAEF
jgi:phosphatidylglycerophosphate synthase